MDCDGAGGLVTGAGGVFAAVVASKPELVSAVVLVSGWASVAPQVETGAFAVVGRPDMGPFRAGCGGGTTEVFTGLVVLCVPIARVFPVANPTAGRVGGAATASFCAGGGGAGGKGLALWVGFGGTGPEAAGGFEVSNFSDSSSNPQSSSASSLVTFAGGDFTGALTTSVLAFVAVPAFAAVGVLKTDNFDVGAEEKNLDDKALLLTEVVLLGVPRFVRAAGLTRSELGVLARDFASSLRPASMRRLRSSMFCSWLRGVDRKASIAASPRCLSAERSEPALSPGRTLVG